MVDIQYKKIILSLIKEKQISPVYRGKNVGSPDIQSILENFYNNKYSIGSKDVPSI